MNKRTCLIFFPDYRSLLLVFLLLCSTSLLADQKSEYANFEKIFQDLQIEALDKQSVKINKLPSKFVIINFWATWCLPCLEEIPSLVKLSKKFTTKDLSVVMINSDAENDFKNIKKTTEKLNIPNSFLIVQDSKLKIADMFKFSAIPVTVIYKNGKVIYFNNGPVDFMNLGFFH